METKAQIKEPILSRETESVFPKSCENGSVNLLPWQLKQQQVLQGFLHLCTWKNDVS